MASTDEALVDLSSLEHRLEALAKKYHPAAPYPHIAIDNLLAPAKAMEAFEKFPSLGEMQGLKNMRQVKAQDPSLDRFPKVFRDIVFGVLHSPRFIQFVSRLTAIPGLIADPQLYAAGLAQGGNGSFLNVHIDNSSHPVRSLYRRVNLILYLNKNWNESKGGQIEFWDNAMKSCDSVLPAFNRAVLFTVSTTSWHGYKKVVTPDGDTRKSINIYYFTEESPTGKPYYHVTSFRARPGEIKNRFLYPIDNWLRTLYRKLRTRKDAHATLFNLSKASSG